MSLQDAVQNELKRRHGSSKSWTPIGYDPAQESYRASAPASTVPTIDQVQAELDRRRKKREAEAAKRQKEEAEKQLKEMRQLAASDIRKQNTNPLTNVTEGQIDRYLARIALSSAGGTYPNVTNTSFEEILRTATPQRPLSENLQDYKNSVLTAEELTRQHSDLGEKLDEITKWNYEYEQGAYPGADNYTTYIQNSHKKKQLEAEQADILQLIQQKQTAEDLSKPSSYWKQTASEKEAALQEAQDPYRAGRNYAGMMQGGVSTKEAGIENWWKPLGVSQELREYDIARENYYYTMNAERWASLPEGLKNRVMEAASISKTGLLDWNDPNATVNNVTQETRYARSQNDAARLNSLKNDIAAAGYDAEALIEYAARMQNAERMQQEKQQAADLADRGFVGKVAATVGSYGTSALSGLGSVGILAQRVFGSGSGIEDYRPVDINTPAQSFSQITTAARGAVSEDMGETGKFLYGTLNSAVDSAVRLLIGKAAASGFVPIGAEAEAAEQVNKLVSGLVSAQMGTQVFTNSFIEAKESGKTDDQAIVDAVVSAAIEAITEKYSVEEIIKNPNGLTAQALANSFAAEASEEMASNILNTIYDELQYGDESRLRSQAQAYIDAGMDPAEAWKIVLKEYGQEVLLDGLAGGISGFGMSAVNEVGNRLNERAYNRILAQAQERNQTSPTASSEAESEETEAPKRTAQKSAGVVLEDGSSARVQNLSYKDGAVSVLVETGDGKTSSVNPKNVQMPEETAELVSMASEFKAAAPVVFAAYEDGQDIASYKDAAELVVSTARASVGVDGAKALNYLHNSKLTEGLTTEQIDVLYQAGRELGIAEPQMIRRGTGTVTWEAQTNRKQLKGRQKASVQFIEDLAKATGLDFVIYETKADSSGSYQGAQGYYARGKIGIDLNAGMYKEGDLEKSAMLRTVSHELTHFLKDAAGEQYAQLQGFMIYHLAAWSNQTLDDLITAKMRRSTKGSISYEEALDEVVADGCEMMLRDSAAIRQLAETNKPLFQRVRDWVGKFLKNLREAFKGLSAEHQESVYLMENYADELQKLWDAALTAAVQSGTDTEIPPANSLMTPSQETRFSLRENEAFMQSAMKENESKRLVPNRIMIAAQKARSEIAAIMRDPKLQDALNLPADLMGKTYFPDGAYNGTEENTLVCPRSMGAEELLDAVSEMIGRPLTVDECIEVSQFIAGSELKPECEYCYVATDRKAYRAFLKSYIDQRDAVIEKYQSGMSKTELYKEFLDGRKDTKNMRDRFTLWTKIVDQNLPMMQASDLSNVNNLMHDIVKPGIRGQVKDAMKYAQSASWAKKRVGYTAYNGHILKWGQTKINQLNKGFGLRMYSFSDFSPAFILENMQMITDAAVRGLKMLAYTKEADFVKIFAPTGININVSTFGFERNGVVAENAMQGVSWKEAQELRAKHPNVGITFVATNDNLVDWALDQDWIDVVIPYHLVRTGKQVAERLGFTNYTSESGDIKASGWTKGIDIGSIPPTMHNNDKQTYLDALEANHLQPRFKRWLHHTNYMKLVNETRLSSLESKPVQPIFDLESAKKSLIGMIKDGGYFQHIGGSVDRMYEIASGIAEQLDNGTVRHSLREHSDLFVQTAYVNIKKGNLATPTGEQASANTPEANNGIVSGNSVPQDGTNRQSQFSERDELAAEITNLEAQIKKLEQGKSDAFLAGQMRTARQAGKDVRKATERIEKLQGQLADARQLAKDTKKATAEERKKAEFRAKNLEAQIKKLNRDLAAMQKKDDALLANAMHKGGKDEATIRKLREELARKQEEYREGLRDYREKRNESESVRYYRERVQKRVRDLQDLLITNSDKKHVPEELKETLTNFLYSLDLSSTSKLEGKRITKADLDIYYRAEQLGKALEKTRNGKTEKIDYFDFPDDMMDRYNALSNTIHEITAGVDAVADSPINLMNAAQLQDLNFVLRVLQKSINDMNKLLATARFQTVAQAAESTISELDQTSEYNLKGKLIEKFRSAINWKNTTPVYAFRRMGEAGQELFRAMWDGQGKFAFDVKEVLDKRKEIVDDKQVRKWSAEVHTIELSEDRTVRMTTAQLMSFYCLSKRQQAMDHLKTGGIRVANINYGSSHIQQAKAYHLSLDDIAKINSMVTEEIRQAADAIQKYMTDRGSEWGNEISMRRFGYRAFTEKVYFPIRTESSQTAKDTKSTQENSINRLLNMSFTKTTKPNAQTCVVVDNIFDVFSGHMSDMAKYHAFALPVLDMIKWFDYNVQDFMKDGMQKDHRAVKTSIENAYGKEAIEYIETFLKDVNGADEGGRTRGAEGYQKLMSHYKAASVGANLRVAIQQPTSYWRAASVINPKYLAMGERAGLNIKPYYEEMTKYAGISVWKEMGFRDFNVGRSVRDQISGTLSAASIATDKVMDASMKLAELGDTWTWCRLWAACKSEVKAKQHLSGEDLLKATAVRFNEVISQTQVVDSVMTRSHMMRSKNFIDQILTPFMAEPTLSYNVVADSVFQLATDARKTNKQEAWKKNRKRMAVAFLTFALTAVYTAFYQSLLDALRDDDDYEKFWEKFWDAFWLGGRPEGKFLDDPFAWIESALDQGNIVANLNLVNNIPGFHREIINMLKGFSNEAMYTAGMENLYNATRATWEKLRLETGQQEKATDLTWNGNMTWFGVTQKDLQAFSQLTGLPVYNLVRDAASLWNLGVGEFMHKPELKMMAYDPGTEKRAAEAYGHGFLSFDDAMEELQKFDVEANDAYFMLTEAAGFKKYERLMDAVLYGGDVQTETQALLDHGVKQKDIYSSIRTAIKEWYVGKEKDDGSRETPLIDEDTALSMLMQYGDKNEDAAKKLVDEWSLYRDTGIQYGDLKQQYLDGNLSREEAAQLMEIYGGKTEEEARASSRTWEFEAKYGYTYDERVSKFKNGELSAGDLVDAMVEFGGKTRDEAKQSVYSYAREAYEDGQMTREQASKVMTQYGGKTPQEAKTSLTYIDLKQSLPDVEIVDEWIDEYYNDISGSGISIETFIRYRDDVRDITGSGKKERRMQIIDSLPISNAQKDSIYFAEGWAQSTLWEAPWH